MAVSHFYRVYEIKSFMITNQQERTWREKLLGDADDYIDGPPWRDVPKWRNSFLFCFRLFSRIVWHLKAVGLDNLPEAPFILAPNHASHFDNFWICCLLYRHLNDIIFSIGKKEHLDRFLTRLSAAAANMIPVDRGGNVMPALRAGAKILQKGGILFLHPEGTRTSDGNLQPFKSGVGILALSLHVPVVPVGIIGSFEVFPNNIEMPRLFKWSKFSRYNITVAFGKSITVEDEVNLGNLDANSSTLAQDFTRLLQSKVAKILSSHASGDQ